MNKQMKQLIKRLEAQGFEVRITTKCHVLVLKDGQRITTLSGTPSDKRAWLNSMSPLKRAGYDVS